MRGFFPTGVIVFIFFLFQRFDCCITQLSFCLNLRDNEFLLACVDSFQPVSSSLSFFIISTFRLQHYPTFFLFEFKRKRVLFCHALILSNQCHRLYLFLLFQRFDCCITKLSFFLNLRDNEFLLSCVDSFQPVSSSLFFFIISTFRLLHYPTISLF